MKRAKLPVIALLSLLVFFVAGQTVSTQTVGAGDVDLVQRDVSSNKVMAKVELAGRTFEPLVAGLLPAIGFSVDVKSPFPEASTVLGSFLAGPRAGAKLAMVVNDAGLLPGQAVSAQVGGAGDVDVVLRDVSSNQAMGKAELAGQRFELKVAGLPPATEFSFEVKGPFPGGLTVLGSFITGPRGGAKQAMEVTDIDLSLVEEIEVYRSNGSGCAVALRGLVQ